MKVREDTENNILNINIGKSEVLDYQIGMIARNKNLNILKFDKVTENGEEILSFNLEGKIKLKDYVTSKKFSKEEVLKLIIDVLDISLNSCDYLLSKENFLLDINFMYYDLQSSNLKLIYIPIINKVSMDIDSELKEFIKVLIVDLIDFKELYEYDGFVGMLLKLAKSKDINAKILKQKIEKMMYGSAVAKQEVKLIRDNEINCFENNFLRESNITETSKEKRNFKSEDLYSFIEDVNEKIQHPFWIKGCILGVQVIVVSLIISLVLANLKIDVLALVSLIFILADVIVVKFLLQYKVEKEEDFSMDKVEGFDDKGFINIGKKEIISQNVYGSAALEKTGPYFLLVNDEITERVYITKNNFIIGRLGNECDYVINNNTIGKKHLKVVKENEVIYIEDLHSKNGTYINEKRIESGRLYKVEENFKIKISNVVLTFKEI